MSEELSRNLGYQFANPNLLKIALTHRSNDDINNERLEFLGDSIVNFIVAEALYQQFPTAQEGELSRWRANLINRDALCILAREFQLGRYLFLGPGELKSGGADRPSILSCAMEAIIGAIYLDGGYTVTRECVLKWFQTLLTSLTSAGDQKDPKTQLQEHLQRYRLPLPVYKVESVHGESHRQTFTVSCSVESVSKNALGKGSSRRRAEQDAAEKMLRIIKNDN
jgi:ribonuclease-3